MEKATSKSKYWLLFIFWLAILVYLLISHREFFWLALPGVCTYFCKGMDLI